MSWPTIKLGDACTVIAGGTPKRSVPEYWGGNIPWVKISDMLQGVITKTDESISILGLESSTAKILPAGTLLVSIFATVGRTAVLGCDATTNQAIVGIIPKNNDDFDTRFLEYTLKEKARELQRKARGIAQNNINSSVLKDTEIPIPPLEEQKRIADILDKADAVRRKRQEALRLADDFLKSTFLDMFGDPVTNPMGWEMRSLDATTALDAPMVEPTAPEFENLLHYGPDRIEKDTGRLLPAKSAKVDGIISKKFLCDDKYLLYSKIRPYLNKVALVSEPCLCSADVYPVRPLDGCFTREFLWFLLRSDAFLKYAESCPSRASIPKLNRGEFALFQAICPPIDIQKLFSKIITSGLAMGKGHSKANMELSNLFNSLSQKAFSGGFQ